MFDTRRSSAVNGNVHTAAGERGGGDGIKTSRKAKLGFPSTAAEEQRWPVFTASSQLR